MIIMKIQFGVGIRRVIACMLLAIIATLNICAQGMSGNSLIESEKLLQSGTSQLKSSLDTKDAQIVYDNVIDAKYYKVGPGDVLSFQKLDALAMEENLVVTPENSVFLPRIGLVEVKGKTLQQVKDTLLLLQKQRTANVPCFVSLKKARTVFVTIRGNVLFPGTIAASASWRVSTAIKSAMQPRSANASEQAALITSKAFGTNGNSQDQMLLKQTSSLLPSYCMRNIYVLHSDGTSDLCDLEKASAYSDPTSDGYIREGDEIFVPTNMLGYPTTSIGGSVARPTTLIYKKDDKVSLLLKSAGRLTNLTGEVKVYLVRNGEKKELSVNEQMVLSGEDIPLLPGDVVVAESGRTMNTSTSTGSVRIVGEVTMPGVYPIANNTTKIKDIISSCGNFTEQAYLPLAYILRNDVNEQNGNGIVNEQIERLKKLQYSNLVLEDTTRFMIDQIAKRPLVACDFSKAFNDNSTNDNVTLQDGDVIVVPKNPRTVYVYGQVKKGGYVEYVKGQGIEYYIALAGGMTENADKGRERIIKGRTGVWLKNDEAIIEAGDIIYVPHPPDEPSAMQAARYGAYASIAGGIVGLFGAFFGLYNILK